MTKKKQFEFTNKYSIFTLRLYFEQIIILGFTYLSIPLYLFTLLSS